MQTIFSAIAGLAGVAALLLTGCHATGPGGQTSGETTTAKADVTVRDADAGRTVHIAQNKILEVRLASSPSTGYSWKAVGAQEDSGQATGALQVGVLAPYGESAHLADPVPAGFVGGGGVDVFLFSARKPGQQVLRFILLRPWEHGGVGKRASFTVVVDAQ